MMLTLAPLVVSGATISILFCGNSHTVVNDVPSMVRNLVASDGSGRRVSTQVLTASFLEEFSADANAMQVVQDSKWDFVILQGLKLSSSHNYQYDHSGAITFAKAAGKKGAKVAFYCEWPRQGWDEAEWMANEYRPVAATAKAQLIVTGRAWPIALKADPKLDLWSADGNHASLKGSFLAACGLYYGLFGVDHEPTWSPKGIDAQSAAKLKKYAKQARS